MLFYLLTFAVGATVVVLLGADLMTGITASISCLGNIGPGFGPIGPMGSFAGPASDQQDRADGLDVDWPSRSADGPRAVPARGVARGTLAGVTRSGGPSGFRAWSVRPIESQVPDAGLGQVEPRETARRVPLEHREPESGGEGIRVEGVSGRCIRTPPDRELAACHTTSNRASISSAV